MDSWGFSPFLSSPPEFHADHRGISLQAPRSHQLPSAAFCRTFSEGKCSTEVFVPLPLQSGKHLASSDPDVPTYVHGIAHRDSSSRSFISILQP